MSRPVTLVWRVRREVLAAALLTSLPLPTVALAAPPTAGLDPAGLTGTVRSVGADILV